MNLIIEIRWLINVILVDIRRNSGHDQWRHGIYLSFWLIILNLFILFTGRCMILHVISCEIFFAGLTLFVRVRCTGLLCFLGWLMSTVLYVRLSVTYVMTLFDSHVLMWICTCSERYCTILRDTIGAHVYDVLCVVFTMYYV